MRSKLSRCACRKRPLGCSTSTHRTTDIRRVAYSSGGTAKREAPKPSKAYAHTCARASWHTHAQPVTVVARCARSVCARARAVCVCVCVCGRARARVNTSANMRMRVTWELACLGGPGDERTHRSRKMNATPCASNASRSISPKRTPPPAFLPLTGWRVYLLTGPVDRTCMAWHGMARHGTASAQPHVRTVPACMPTLGHAHTRMHVHTHSRA